MACTMSEKVATREGGVDRNHKRSDERGGQDVATREGGVDRNISADKYQAGVAGRHPRGWRG